MTIFLRVAIILRYRGCRVWVLAAFWGTLFQLAVSPFSRIYRVMEEVGKKVGRMLNEEASRGKTMEGLEEMITIEGLTKWYHWWMPADHVERVVAPSYKTEDIASLFEGKNTRV